MQQYTTFFEITQKGFVWWFPAGGVLIALFALFVVRPKYRGNKWIYVVVVFGSLWSLLTFSSTLSAYRGAQQAYRTGQFRVVEGPVENFDPMPWTGHKDECFSVQRVRFCYSDFGITPGFNETSSHGGQFAHGCPFGFLISATRSSNWKSSLIALPHKRKPGADD
jgi:hypothetical protein